MKRQITTAIIFIATTMLTSAQEVVRYTIVDSDMSSDGKENWYTAKADQFPAGTKIDYTDGTTSKGTTAYSVGATWYDAYSIDQQNNVVPYAYDATETEQTFYFQMPESWSQSTPNIHIYHNAGTDVTDVNSTPMTELDGYEGWYSYTFTNRGSMPYYVMFNINNWEQQSDAYEVTDTNDHYFTINSDNQVIEAQRPTSTTTIYFKRPETYTFIPHVHIYIYNGGEGSDITYVDNQNMIPWAGHEDWFYYNYDNTGEAYCIIFNDHGWGNSGGQTQTINVTDNIFEDKYFTTEGETSAPTTTDKYATIKVTIPDSWDAGQTADADITTIQLYNASGSSTAYGVFPDRSTLDASTLDEMAPDGDGGYYYYLYGTHEKYKFEISEANVNSIENWEGATPATTYFSPAYNTNSPTNASYYINSENYVFLSGTTDIAEIEIERPSAVEYYNLQGMKVETDNLVPGLYIVKQNASTKKVQIK